MKTMPTAAVINELNPYNRYLSSEQILWLEVINSAVQDYRMFWESKHKTLSKFKEARLARAWICNNGVDLGDFIGCCEVVFSDPSYAINFIRCACICKLPTLREFLTTNPECIVPAYIDRAIHNNDSTIEDPVETIEQLFGIPEPVSKHVSLKAKDFVLV